MMKIIQKQISNKTFLIFTILLDCQLNNQEQTSVMLNICK